ncbi:MAG: SPASM domain-containing protein, partial [Terriglobia bacterium]
GEVYPSGFLPRSAGNVRAETLTEIYRNSSLMRELRDPEALHGRCRQCEYRSICGGSRSRAYALTGDYLATDPWCAYQPQRPGA